MLKLTLFTIILLLVNLSSCSPCMYLDCASSNFYGQFRIVSASSGNDLIFGPNRIYDKSQIKFYSLKGSDTTFFDYQTIRFPGTGYDSILHVFFFPKPETAYMKLSNGDIDTFLISSETIKSKCCGTTTNITNFRFNNIVDIPGNKGTQAIKK